MSQTEPRWPDPTRPSKLERMRRVLAAGPVVKPPRMTAPIQGPEPEPEPLTGIEREEALSELARIEYEVFKDGQARRRG